MNSEQTRAVFAAENWTKIYLVLTLLALAIGVRHYLGEHYHPVLLPEHHLLPYVLYYVLVETYLWFALFFLIFKCTGKLPFPDSGKLLLLHFPLGLLFAAGHAELHTFLNWLPFCMKQPFLPAPLMYRFGYFVKLANGIIVYFILVAVSYGIIFFRKSSEKRIQANRFLYQLEEQELQEFKMNLLPGVLLRMLDSVSGLIDRDPDTSEELVAGLGDYLRRHLRTLQRKTVSVSDELDLVHSFRETAVHGMKKAVIIDVSVSSDASRAKIPGFLIQGPVEWIIENMDANLTCRISILGEKREGDLRLMVHCFGKGIPAIPQTAIIAMQKRLRATYQDDYELNAGFRTDERYEMELIAPFQPIEEPVDTRPLQIGNISEPPNEEASGRMDSSYQRPTLLWGWGCLAWAGVLITYFAGRFTDMLSTQRLQEILSIHRFHELSVWLVWAFFTPAILWMRKRFPLKKSWLVGSLPVHVVANIFIWCLATFVFLWEMDKLNSCWNVPYVLTDGLEEGFSAHIYWAVIGIASVVEDYRKYRQEEIRNWHLRSLVANAQVRELKMQLQPHFLFNTLNSLIELIHVNPKAAKEMVQRLIRFLGDTVETADVREVSFRKELELLSQYLQLQKVRFQDRLHVDLDIDPESLTNRVPHFLLQPIVENALRYGTSVPEDVGRISIRSHCSGGILELQVRDKGPGIKGSVKEGIGLSNTRRRLEQFYGENYDFAFVNDPEGGLIVTLQIPDRKYSYAG